MKRTLLLSAVLVALLPIMALAIPNPLRVFAPSMFGSTCDSNHLCVEDPRQLAEAQALAVSALAHVTKKLGELKSRPTIIFCSTETCFNMFGKRRATSVAFGSKAVLIGPRGWATHYVRHELIHVVQYQKLGLIRAWRAPKWLTEGMAYSLSEDPRRPLPGELESSRAAFERKFAREERETLWIKVEESLDVTEHPNP